MVKPHAPVVAGLAVLLAVGLPAVDRLVPAPADLVRPGDRLNLGGGVTIAPPQGWRLLEGIRVTDRTVAPVRPGDGDATLQRGGATVVIHLAAFDGGPEALLDQVDRVNARARPALAVTGGRVAVAAGLVEPFAGPSSRGLVAAYTFDGTGMTVVAHAGADGLAGRAAEIHAMLGSVAR
ncbi:hypothetical protein [Dactylosporangium sp. CA-139066]|uniref:hypothetical protein n=1 Tax=Dactylosporangium sp. CA-139066 TaxID=3239930 RepID=UPI003D8C91CB